MAENGRAGHRFSHAPQPMQIASFTAGTIIDFSSLGFTGTIVMAPAGQWRAQFPHDLWSVTGMQFFFIHTACPLCKDDL